MEILKKVEPGKANMTQPVIAPIIRKQPDGVYEGIIYATIGGIPCGHLQVVAGGLDQLKILLQGLAAYIQSQESQRELIQRVQPFPGMKG